MTPPTPRHNKTPGLPRLQPLLISVDPARDTPKVLKEYLKGCFYLVVSTDSIFLTIADFHPRILGLTGTDEQLHQVTKAYRVYYSAAPVDEDNEYLVSYVTYYLWEYRLTQKFCYFFCAGGSHYCPGGAFDTPTRWDTNDFTLFLVAG